MWQILGIFLLIGLIVFAIKMAIVLLLLAGLIFRTKETLGLIVILAAFALWEAHPILGFGFIAILALIGIVRAIQTTRKEDIEPPA